MAVGGGFMVPLVRRLSVFHTYTEGGAPAVVDGCESTAAEHDLSLPPYLHTALYCIYLTSLSVL